MANSDMNVVVMSGRIASDPVFKQIGQDKNVVNFRLAVNHYTDTTASFIPCVAWGNAAKVINQYAPKGKEILVHGYLKVRTWESGTETKYITEIIINDVKLLGGKDKDSRSNEEVDVVREDDMVPF